MLVGLGYDIHPLQKGRKLVLGGVEIPYDKGLLGHSDGDVLTHALCDAILGAMGRGDLGEHFSPTDPQYKDIYSLILLERVLKLMQKSNLKIKNLDLTLILQEPKISPYKVKIKEKLNSLLNLPTDRLNLKATSPEGLGALGRAEGIASLAVANLEEI